MKPPEARHSRARKASNGPVKKTPLTYYRSAKADSSKSSPFEVAKESSNKFRAFVSRVLDLLMVGLVIFLLVYSLLVKSNPAVSVDNEIYHGANIYKDAAIKELEQIKNRTKLTLDDNEIIESLQRKFPEIYSAHIELPLFSQTPTVHINVSTPSFFINTDTASYVVDNKGTAIARASELPQIKNLPILKDQTSFEITPGKQVISAKSVNFIKDLTAQCKRANVSISSLSLPPLAQELDLKTSDQPYFVKFYLNGDALEQIGQFLATRKQLQQSNIKPAEYLDVRVPGKIFYK